MSNRVFALLFVLFSDTPAWAADTLLGKHLAALRGPDAVAASEAAKRLGTASFSGYEVEIEHQKILAALSDPRLWVADAAMKCLTRGSTWKEEKLVAALLNVLDGTFSTSDPSLAVKPLIARLPASERLAPLRRAFSQSDERVLMALLAQPRKIKVELREPSIRQRVLQLLSHSDEALATAALAALFETMGNADHGDIAVIAKELTSTICKPVRTKALALFLELRPHTADDRAAILASLGALGKKQSPTSVEGKLSASLISHFQTAPQTLKEREAKPAACPEEVRKPNSFNRPVKF